ncbi:EF hand domain containing protein [Acanthamoeba castellanii str. Neff]|uniref:EF hand domain containing protein n=1 Tax=Acanthamoeba castellanii (strain ATCC 30010 / Neff) TaxID=1257118 RepID=L8H5B3_ACACF|nr:EF hand domain containing protein [Acanthamoeba castellanii str. Neff]ELR19928.1 EF hand domain containing protein [Acanthamoeba castellanii str. Neff]
MKKVLNALGGGTKGLEEVSAAEVASGTYLSVEEVTALMEAFKAKGNSKGPHRAEAVVEEVNRTYHQPLFNHDEAQLTFHLLDTNHDGKVDPFELIYGVSVLCEGSEQDKAELVFKAIDLDNNGRISKAELLGYLEITFTVAEKIAKEHIKRGKLAHKKELLDLAANAKQSLLDKNIDDIFKADTNKAAFSPSIDLEEWRTAIANNAAIKSLINPSRSVYVIQETVDREARE